ncbi:MAG TPA: SDR family NAD(P)-dependent oxidoreductase [Sphingomonas sp.]
MKLAGKTAIVTGGNDGIGREIARALKAKGATVIVVGRDAGRLEAAAAEGFETIAADLATPGGVDAVAAAAASRPIDVLINNAGMGADYLIDEPIDLAEVDRCVALNLTAPIHLITRLLPALRTRPEAIIVNVTSGLAIAPNARSPVYCATKAGLRSFTLALRGQLAGSRVHILEALPPVVETRMTEGNTHKKLPAHECARQIVAAMEAGRDEANVGMTRMLRAAYSVSPAFARRIMLRY